MRKLVALLVFAGLLAVGCGPTTPTGTKTTPPTSGPKTTTPTTPPKDTAKPPTEEKKDKNP